MTNAHAGEPTARKPLRLWPGVVAVVLQWVAFLLPRVAPEAGLYGLLGAALFALVVVLWWLFFSRAPWLERVGALVLMPLAVPAARLLVHPYVARAGMGNMLYFFADPRPVPRARRLGGGHPPPLRRTEASRRWSPPSCWGAGC